jgi:D-arabinose 1-dehydrogenase-like Zn-dependent alcohol dehydrogenase
VARAYVPAIHCERGILTFSAVPMIIQPTQVGGHEGIGIIHKLGPGSENGRVKVGDRVGIKASIPGEEADVARKLRVV